MFIFSLVLSFLLTNIFIKFSLPILNQFLLDTPNKRSLHMKPVPKGGGIFFSSISSLFLIIFNNYLGLLCLPIALIGILDDRFNISRKFRYFSQLLSVFLLISCGNGYFNSLSIENKIISFSLLLFLLILGTSLVNFTNFMDGIDGLVGGCMIIWFTTISISENHTYLLLVAPLLAFLIWNWSPAKLFMGDAGSTFLGLMVFGVIFNLSSLVKIINSLLILTPLYFDAISCIFMRLINKENIFRPHKLHLYQRLYKAGMSKSKVSIIYISGTFLLSISFLIDKYYILYFSSLLCVIFGIVLNQSKAYNFKNSL